LCVNQVPGDYDKVLDEYTRNGYRVLALAKKELKNVDSKNLLNVRREDVES